MRALGAFVLCAALAAPEGARLSDWLATGGSFAGSRVSGYDARTGVLQAVRGAAASQLTLRGESTLDAAASSRLDHDKRVADRVQHLDGFRAVLRIVAQAGPGGARCTAPEVRRTDCKGPEEDDVTGAMESKGAQGSETHERLLWYGVGNSTAALSLSGGRFAGAGDPVTADEVREVMARLDELASNVTN